MFNKAHFKLKSKVYGIENIPSQRSVFPLHKICQKQLHLAGNSLITNCHLEARLALSDNGHHF